MDAESKDVDPLSLDEFEVYKLSRQLRRKLYALAGNLPESEKYNLVSQMRRAALSITANIAEGHGRFHYSDVVRFFIQARGSVSEVLDELNLCLDEEYLGRKEVDSLKRECVTLTKRINSYIAYLKRRKKADEE